MQRRFKQACGTSTLQSLCRATSMVIFATGLGSAGLAQAPTQAPGTRRMAERLQQLIREAGVQKNPYLSLERAAWAKGQLARGPAGDAEQTLNLHLMLGHESLQGGDCASAAETFKRLIGLLERQMPEVARRDRGQYRMLIAQSWLRMGELENCLSNHTTDSCLAPISAGGVHRLQRGSRGAMAVLQEQLQENPGDLGARWLLNIACMTVGEYPDKVPARWRIDPKVFASDYDLPRFRDVASGLGVDVDDLAGGCIVEDFDGDGYLDLVCSSMHWQGQLRYFRNNRDGTFGERTREAGLIGEVGGLNIVSTDYNNDGFVDVLVLRGGWQRELGRFPNSLLRNNGDGTFANVTEEAGLLSFHPTQTAAWFDYNGDGWLDLFFGNESTPGEKHPCELFRNNGNGTFTECAQAAGVAIVGFVKAVACGDFNNDGRPDLYLSRQMEPNTLLRNDGPAGTNAAWKFTDVTARAGVAEPMDSFPAWFFDYDNDGWLDLFVSGYFAAGVGAVAADYLGLPSQGERPRLYRNNRDGTFSNVTAPARLNKVLLTMGANFGDLDNDGWLDFYLGTGDPEFSTLIPNRMFRNAEGRFFQDVTTAGGFGHLQKGHGIAFADIDHDGDQDIYEVMGGFYPGDHYHNVLYENPGHGNHWITLKLEGVKSNRAAFGARIKVTVKTESGARTIYRTVSTGGSFGCSPLRQEIGLGRAQAVESVEISWPATGQVQVLTGLGMDRFYKVREGESHASEWALKRVKFVLVPDKICGPPQWAR
jgi:hypothetical protein